MNGKIYPVLDDFSLTNDGILYKLISRIGLGGASAKHLTLRILFLIAITWLPLFALTAMQGLAFGSKVDIPFWNDFSIHSRFLIILPLLIFAEGPFDFRLKELTMQFFSSGILNEKDLDSFNVIKKKVKVLTDSIWPDLLIFIIIIINLSSCAVEN
jgi:hypothetical protein